MERRDIAEVAAMTGLVKIASLFSENIFHIVCLDYHEMSAV